MTRGSECTAKRSSASLARKGRSCTRAPVSVGSVGMFESDMRFPVAIGVAILRCEKIRSVRDEQRQVARLEQVPRRAAEYELGNARVTPRTHDDQVGRRRVRRVEQRARAFLARRLE